MQGRGNARFPCTPSPKPTSTTNKNRLAARTGKKLGCGNDARWNPWKSPTPTFPPLPPHLEIPQQTRDSHIPTATTTTGYRGLDQHQTKFNTKINTKINTNNKTKVVYTDNLTHPRAREKTASLYSIPQLPLPTTTAPTRVDVTTIRQNIAATHHLLQLLQPQLEDKARRKLRRLTQRLLNIDNELDYLTPK